MSPIVIVGVGTPRLDEDELDDGAEEELDEEEDELDEEEEELDEEDEVFQDKWLRDDSDEESDEEEFDADSPMEAIVPQDASASAAKNAANMILRFFIDAFLFLYFEIIALPSSAKKPAVFGWLRFFA